MKNIFEHYSMKERIIAIALFVAVFFLIFTVRNFRLWDNEALNFNSKTELILEQSASLDELLAKLDSSSVDYNRPNFMWTSRILGWRSFKKGRYELDGGYGFEEFFRKLAFGERDPLLVVIPPGITKERFANILSNNFNFDSLAVINQLSDSSFLADLDVSKEQLFGKMLPDTYSFYWSNSAEDVILKIHSEFVRKVRKPYEDRFEELNKTENEIVALASIIEWEANIDDEKATVSGLYWNRLNRRMMLQADPTVNFALGERRRLLYEDYRIDHPYNTYRIIGLPPGPITNPSLKSIEAALFPEEHSYLYMVANPQGRHTFTQTYAQHQVESEKWRRWLREQYRIRRELDAAEENSDTK